MNFRNVRTSGSLLLVGRIPRDCAEKIDGLRVIYITGCVQLTGIDTYSATGTGINLYFTESVIFFALFYSPVFQEDIDHFSRDMHVPGKW